MKSSPSESLNRIDSSIDIGELPSSLVSSSSSSRDVSQARHRPAVDDGYMDRGRRCEVLVLVQSYASV